MQLTLQKPVDPPATDVMVIEKVPEGDDDLEALDADLLAELALLTPIFEKSKEESITLKVNVAGGNLLSMEALLS